MNHEQLVLKAVLTARKYNKQLNKEVLIYKYSLISDSLLKAYIDELNLIHAEEPEFIPDEPADEYDCEPEYYEYEHYNDYLWNM
jgi:hypothetical protein